MSYLNNLYTPPNLLNERYTWDEIDDYLKNRYGPKPGEKFNPDNKYYSMINKIGERFEKEVQAKYGPNPTDKQYKDAWASVRKPKHAKNNNLKYGLGAAAVGGLGLAGLYRYATKNPNSFLGRKLAALKARFNKK